MTKAGAQIDDVRQKLDRRAKPHAARQRSRRLPRASTTYPCNGQSALCRCLTLGLASPCIVGVGGSELNTLNSCGAIMGYDYARVYVIDRCANSGNLD
jgi:hypothetical protein